MSRRIRENRWRSSVTRWVCRMIGHDFAVFPMSEVRQRGFIAICDRCGRVW